MRSGKLLKILIRINPRSGWFGLLTASKLEFCCIFGKLFEPKAPQFADEEPVARKASQIYNKILISDNLFAVKRPNQPLRGEMYRNAQFIF